MAHTIDSVLEESKREIKEKHKGEEMNYLQGAVEVIVIVSVLVMAWLVVNTVDNLYTQMVAIPAVLWAGYRLVIQFAK